MEIQIRGSEIETAVAAREYSESFVSDATAGSAQFVMEGIEIHPHGNYETVDIDGGYARLYHNGATYHVVVQPTYDIDLPSATGTNHIFLSYDPGVTNTQWTSPVSYHIDTDNTAPTGPALKIGEIDAGTGSTTGSNRDLSTVSADTRTDLADSGGVVASDPSEIAVTASGAASVTATDDGDGTATLNVSATDTNTNTQNDLKDQISHSVPITSLADTDYVDVPLRIPTGKTAKVWLWGARTDAQTTPTGLTVGLYDFGAAAYVVSSNTSHATGSPITSLSGAADAALRVENTSGGSLNAGGVFGVTIE